jgi:hypothetical protein
MVLDFRVLLLFARFDMLLGCTVTFLVRLYGRLFRVFRKI